MVFLDVNVDCKNTHGLSHDEGEGAEVKGPAVVVVVLLVLVFLVTGVPGVAGDVDDDGDVVPECRPIL